MVLPSNIYFPSAEGGVLGSPLRGIKATDISVAAQNHRLPVVLVCDGLASEDVAVLRALLRWLFQQQSSHQAMLPEGNTISHRLSVSVMTTGEHVPYIIPPRLLGEPLGGDGGEVFFPSCSWLEADEWDRLLQEVSCQSEANWETMMPWLYQLLVREGNARMPFPIYNQLDALTIVVVLSANSVASQRQVAQLLNGFSVQLLWYQKTDAWQDENSVGWKKFCDNLRNALASASVELTKAENAPKVRVINNVFPDICLPNLQGQRTFLVPPASADVESNPLALLSICAVRDDNVPMLVGEGVLPIQAMNVKVALTGKDSGDFQKITTECHPLPNDDAHCILTVRLKPQDWQELPCGKILQGRLEYTAGMAVIRIPLILAVWRATFDFDGFPTLTNEAEADVPQRSSQVTQTPSEPTVGHGGGSALGCLVGVVVCLISLAVAVFFYLKYRQCKQEYDRLKANPFFQDVVDVLSLPDEISSKSVLEEIKVLKDNGRDFQELYGVLGLSGDEATAQTAIDNVGKLKEIADPKTIDWITQVYSKLYPNERKTSVLDMRRKITDEIQNLINKSNSVRGPDIGPVEAKLRETIKERDNLQVKVKELNQQVTSLKDKVRELEKTNKDQDNMIKFLINR